MAFFRFFKKKQESKPDSAQADNGAKIDQCLTVKPTFSSPLRGILYKLASKATFLESQQRLLQEMEEQGYLVYACKYRSQLDFMFLCSRLSQAGLQPPVFAFDTRPLLWLHFVKAIRLIISFLHHYLKEGGFPNPYQTGDYRELVLAEEPSVLFLVGKTGYYRRVGLIQQDPLHLLADIQRATEKPIILVPTLIFHGKAPEKQHKGIVDVFFGDKERPGKLRKLFSFLRNYKNNILEIAEPLNLKVWLEDQPNLDSSKTGLAFLLRRDLIDRIDRHRRVVTGPIMKSRWEIKEMVLHNNDLQKRMERRARTNNRTIEIVRKEADNYLDEIATDPHLTYVQIGERLLTWIWNTIYDGIEVDVDSLDMVKHAAQKAPLVYIPCHKSHIDYLVLSYLLYKHNLNLPLVAAGKNLAFWPLGPFFRKSGAFFIRRSFRGHKFYTDVFAAYIKTLVSEGHNLEFFIEGGRSRTGKMVLPKLGLLAILMQAVEEGYCDDLIFVPCAINYDRVMEEGAYLRRSRVVARNRKTWPS